ncbi:MAG: glycosyltransferase family 2 protein [Gammaproteobacteria bacterium]|nr:glycosyltransferase family 2 protein [Gammaproteobacteria bacterium]
MSNPAPPRVNILLSTYNGERFITEQLDSLFSQSYPNIAIHIRDDGSTDRTVGIIKIHPRHGELGSFDTGNNVGVVPSFLQLVTCHGEPGDLYAFCDQDDVWKPEKIARAVERIMKRPQPDKVLYCSRLEYVDDDLAHLGYSLVPRQTGFGNAVMENVAIGCTSVFGDTIRQRLSEESTEKMIMHDWWAYLTATAFGEVIYDDFASLQYRQHSNTFTAWEPGHKKLHARARDFAVRFMAREHKGLDSLNQAISFINTYPDAPNDVKKIVNTLIELRTRGNLWRRFRYVTHPEVFRTEPMENRALKIMILLGLH